MILGDICTVDGFKSHTRTLMDFSSVHKTKDLNRSSNLFPSTKSFIMD